MLKAIILVLLFALIGFAAVKVLVAVVTLAAMLVSAVVRHLVVPVLTLPIRLTSLVLAPEPRAGRAAYRPDYPRLGSACGNRVCRCPNPAGARFCRRCGTLVA